MNIITTPFRLFLLCACSVLLIACGGDSSKSAPDETGGSANEPVFETEILQAEEMTLLTNPENPRTENLGTNFMEPVQTYQGEFGTGVGWIMLPGDGVEFTTTVETGSLSMTYLTAIGGDISVVVDGEEVGQLTTVVNSSNWSTYLANTPTAVSITFQEPLAVGSIIQIVLLSETSPVPGIDYITLNPTETSDQDPIEPLEPAATISAKYMPMNQQVLVFAGQDNETLGGTMNYNDGYIDHVGTPAGITHYIGFDGDDGVRGLNNTANWGAGDMNLRHYAEEASLTGTVLHVAVYYAGVADEIVSGEKDEFIAELAAFMNEFSHVPFMLRIGYEFDGIHNGYEAESWKASWIKIVTDLSAAGVTNFATVMHALSMNTPIAIWDSFYPGDEYVDWFGYSYWDGHSTTASSLEFARHKGKPVCLYESTPVNFDLENQTAEDVWNGWFSTYLSHINENSDVIRAVSYINTDWASQPLWEQNVFFNRTDARIQSNPELLDRWQELMATEQFIHGNTDTFGAIGF